MHKYLLTFLVACVFTNVAAQASESFSPTHLTKVEEPLTVENDEDTVLLVEKVDQVSDAISLYFHNHLSTTNLSVAASAGDKTFTVVSNTNFVTGSLVDFEESGHLFQAYITNVVGSNITINIPLDRDYSTSAELTVGPNNMAVNGSTTPVEFQIGPPAGVEWDITGVNFVMKDNDPMDGGTFCAISGGIPNGIYFKYEDGVDSIFGFSRTNSELAVRGCVTQYVDDTLGPSGMWSFKAKCEYNGDSNYGTVIRLNGDENEKLKIIVQDNITTGCDEIEATVQGHRTDY